MASPVAREFAVPPGFRILETLTDATAWVGYQPHEHLAVVGAAVPFIDAAAFAGYMHSIYPDVALVLLRHPDEDDVAPEALAVGFAAVVPAGSPGELADACRRVGGVEVEFYESFEPTEPVGTTTAQPPGRTAALVVVFSAKGGSGTTVLSTNVAMALAGGASVCLVDLDLEFGDVAICLQLAPARTIADAAALELADDRSVDALITTHPASGVDCVLAPSNPKDADGISAATVGQLLDRLRQRYDYVVVDTPSQLSEQVLEAFDRAAHHVIVLTPEIPALKSTRLTLEMLDLIGYPNAQRSLVLNRSDRKAGLGVGDVVSTLRTSVSVALPATDAVPHSVNRGVALLSTEPTHPFARAVGEFTARTITGAAAPTPSRRHRTRTRRRST